MAPLPKIVVAAEGTCGPVFGLAAETAGASDEEEDSLERLGDGNSVCKLAFAGLEVTEYLRGSAPETLVDRVACEPWLDGGRSAMELEDTVEGKARTLRAGEVGLVLLCGPFPLPR